ncbi:TonB-dependent receptor plug domain-containing protein, partial [Rhodoblastus sp.]|uniref:TonB-dependent receptor plug domain-containing protein n=1 Tax=Rhodoblastus sp. TaxID=1962975 RepID=UPI003F9ABD9F
MNRLRAALLASVAVFGPPSLALAQSGQPLPDIDVTTDVPTAAPRVVAPAPTPASAPAAAPAAETAAAVAPFNFTQDVTPANNTRIDAQEIQRTGSPDAAAVLKRVAPSVDIQGTSGNELTPDVVYRGFVSSPIQGAPQGLAVYQNGVRVNEAFGDTMNWDAIPTFAIASMDVISSNPVYGLNALGGAINIKMKDGFTSQGGQLQLSGGSYGRFQGALEDGKQVGDFAFYGALEGVQDNGFRELGASAIKRFYGDLGYRANGNEFHITASVADNEFGASGPAPIQMLQQYWGSAYTTPQTLHYQIGQIALSGNVSLSPSWTLTTNAYVRRYIQHTLDGNSTNVQVCADPALLCFNDSMTPANGLNGQQLANPFGPNPVLGEIDRSTFLTTSFGGGAQLS